MSSKQIQSYQERIQLEPLFPGMNGVVHMAKDKIAELVAEYVRTGKLETDTIQLKNNLGAEVQILRQGDGVLVAQFNPADSDNCYSQALIDFKSFRTHGKSDNNDMELVELVNGVFPSAKPKVIFVKESQDKEEESDSALFDRAEQYTRDLFQTVYGSPYG